MKSTESLIARLTAMLAAVPEDADYSSVTDEQLAEVRDLFGDILDARFPSISRDNNPVEMFLVNRSKFRGHYIVFPNGSPDLHDVPAMFTHVAELSRSVEHAAGLAHDSQRMISFYTSEIAKRMANEGDRAREIAAFVELIEAQELEKAETERDRLLDKYAPVPQFADEEYPDSSRKVPDDLGAAINKLSFLIPKDRVDAAVAEVAAEIDKVEPLVGKVYIDERGGVTSAFTRAETGHIWRMIRSNAARLGEQSLRDVIVRYNRLSNEDRGLRLHAQRTKAIQEA